MTADNFPTLTVVRERPYQAPRGWMVFNAPRPLYGHKDWKGDFLTGVFFVAVDPDAPDAGDMVNRNRDLDARLLVYISQEEWDRRIDEYGAMMEEEYDIKLADFARRDVESSYYEWRKRQGKDIIMPRRGDSGRQS